MSQIHGDSITLHAEIFQDSNHRGFSPYPGKGITEDWDFC